MSEGKEIGFQSISLEIFLEQLKEMDKELIPKLRDDITEWEKICKSYLGIIEDYVWNACECGDLMKLRSPVLEKLNDMCLFQCPSCKNIKYDTREHVSMEMML